MKSYKEKKPERCWQCKKLLNENRPPFFCNLKCGYDWALRNASTLNLIKLRAQQ